MRNESQLTPKKLFSPQHHAGRAVGPEVEPDRSTAWRGGGQGAPSPHGELGLARGRQPRVTARRT